MVFEEFYRLHADRLHRALALTLGDHHLAREATDEAMARAYLHWARVSNYDNPGGWVYRVGLNWATSWWRRFGREHPVPDPPSAVNVAGPGGHLALDLLATLPVRLRSVIVCRLLLQLSTAETASVLDLAQGTVKSRLSRGIEALRTIYLRTEQER
ncbi:RNA polymerase sigma24 factor [Rhizocola hellebori]|uniref:RNA polymerase sigma24 factor n=1 Tax=Rhizocola hellebori TaxID=1392758 RepID=A0A8J3VGA0_9ACTN|nr:RNA polymerase sigma24 factor [Rhizocola hellebori]